MSRIRSAEWARGLRRRGRRKRPPQLEWSREVVVSLNSGVFVLSYNDLLAARWVVALLGHEGFIRLLSRKNRPTQAWNVLVGRLGPKVRRIPVQFLDFKLLAKLWREKEEAFRRENFWWEARRFR